MCDGQKRRVLGVPFKGKICLRTYIQPHRYQSAKRLKNLPRGMVANSYGISIIGTPGFIEIGYEKGMVHNLRGTYLKMKKEDIRLAEELIKNSLDRFGIGLQELKNSDEYKYENIEKYLHRKNSTSLRSGSWLKICGERGKKWLL